jgi:hypothetical protein
MRHVPRLRRLARLYITDPGLPPWARYISRLRRSRDASLAFVYLIVLDLDR